MENHCLCVYVNSIKKINANIVISISVQEIYNKLLIPPEEDVFKAEGDEDNNIIVIDSTLRHILPPQLKNITYQYKFMCGCEWCISDKSMHS